MVQELKICRYGLMDRVRAQETCGISMLARKQLRANGRVGQLLPRYFLGTSQSVAKWLRGVVFLPFLDFSASLGLVPFSFGTTNTWYLPIFLI